jgi:hypothetical protein
VWVSRTREAGGGAYPRTGSEDAHPQWVSLTSDWVAQPSASRFGLNDPKFARAV